MEINVINNYRIIHLTDGENIKKAGDLIKSNKADGVNINFIKNHKENLNNLGLIKNIMSIQINDITKNFDYNIINSFSSLENLNIYTNDKKEINYINYPKLKSTSLFWRPKANSIFNCIHLKKIFLGKYTGKNLLKFSDLTQLEYLRLNTGSIISLDGISNLKNLKNLYLMQTSKLEDISGIEKLINLNYIMINNCKNIKNINILNKLNKKVKIDIIGTTPKLNS